MKAIESLSINVILAGRSYRIRVEAAQEGAVRKAVKRADEQIKELRMHYAGKDDQDFVAMCLLMYAAEHGTATDSLAAEEAEALIRKIDEVLDAEAQLNNG